jgi:putative membrane protein
MEDVPQSLRTEIESHGKQLGFSDVLVVDSHNAMGGQLADTDRNSMVLAAKKSLEESADQVQKKFGVGFASLNDIPNPIATPELGEAGIAVMAFAVGDSTYAVGWADSNNLHNELRERILSRVGGALSMLEVCTSDTHSTSGKRTREGYYALGDVGGVESIASAFERVARISAERATACNYEVASSSSKVKVMGSKLFRDYSYALDNSMRVTKIFLGVTAFVYVLMLIFS